MTTYEEFRTEVSRYLRGEITRRALYRWMLKYTMDIPDRSENEPLLSHSRTVLGGSILCDVGDYPEDVLRADLATKIAGAH